MGGERRSLGDVPPPLVLSGSPPLHTLPAYSSSLHTHHDVSVETEGKPVGEHPLGYGLCSPQEELRVGLGHCAANQLTQQGTEDPAGGEKKGQKMITTYTVGSQRISLPTLLPSRSDSSPSIPPSSLSLPLVSSPHPSFPFLSLLLSPLLSLP